MPKAQAHKVPPPPSGQDLQGALFTDSLCSVPESDTLEHSPEGLGPPGIQLSTPPVPTDEQPDGQIRIKSDNFHRDTCRCSYQLSWYAHGDLGDGPHGWAVPDGNCRRKNCTSEPCVRHFTRQRAKRVKRLYQRLSERVRAPVGYLALVYTVPKGLRPFTSDGMADLRRAARDVTRRWLAEVNDIDIPARGHGWKIGGLDVIHPEGDSQPGAWHPHVHMEVPNWLYWSGELGCDCDLCRKSRWTRIRMRVEKYHLQMLRWLWGRELTRLFGWHPPGGWNYAACSVDLKWRTAKKPRQWAHRIRYDLRHWPQYQPGLTRICYFGYLSGRYRKTLALSGKEQAGEIQPYDVCPICGQVAEWSGSICARTITIASLVRANAPPFAIEARKRVRRLW